MKDIVLPGREYYKPFMRPSRVKRRWRDGKPAICTAVALNDPSVAELVSLLGFDCLWIDLEHHGVSVETAAQLMRAARVGGADVMARPAKGEFMRMGRLLEMGASGILYPRCDDALEAAEVVRWSKFAPMGERGIDGGNPDNPYLLSGVEDYVQHANEETFIGVQVESPSAVAHARAMAEVEGVDLLFFGPGDYSVLSGVPGKTDAPVVREAMEVTCREALAAGKRFGTISGDADSARRLLEMGATFVVQSADIVLLRDGLLRLREELSACGFAFEA